MDVAPPLVECGDEQGAAGNLSSPLSGARSPQAENWPWEKCLGLGTIPAPFRHQPVPLNIPMLSDGQVAERQRHDSLEELPALTQEQL